ncbi:NADH dehydrogenase [ubiquinone] iron-sulfur protein 6, mitochondrial isoform 4 precursor [Mus musculus]|uniref:NADH dehydrogenase [ubiquinone] iron-sulfur protein 6, mitochondrial isoform 4 precursor n=1 Tax=Mus musculus TaxID=10090 RepID=UPI00272E2B20|nr:NADH dehydrogenase [ubiquinone] iron-sulfur protein 6, mitochondrial isoform 4 precursor [Mus musculus]
MAAVLTFRRLLTLPRAARGFGVQVSPSGEKITHTGQVYDEKDYRRVRFVDRQKEVNENFAIDLIAQQPVNEVEHRIIACDGGGGALGHPKVTKKQKRGHVATAACSSSSTITSVGCVLVL